MATGPLPFDIHSNGNFPIFNIQSSGDLSIEQAILTGGSAMNGSVIQNRGILQLSESVLKEGPNALPGSVLLLNEIGGKIRIENNVEVGKQE